MDYASSGTLAGSTSAVQQVVQLASPAFSCGVEGQSTEIRF